MRTLSFIAALLAAGTPALAQDKTAEIDKIFSWVAPDGPGCVAAASHHGKVVVNRAYGLADLDRGVPLTPDSVFDVGSVRKQFVAAAILLLVEEGRLSLADDVRKHIPELPDYGHTITLDHLLTHTSGLRDWVPILNLARGEPDAMSMILRQRGLNFAPGEEFGYSNTGYVLLPEIVERVSGMPFPEFLRTRVLEPLGMRQTTYVEDPRFVIRNRALAYEKTGDRWKMDMLLENDRGGAGALFSTASDLLVWNDALTQERLGTFVSEKMQEPATLNDGTTLDYARGLMLASNHAGRLIWHGGSAAAYKSVLGRFPDAAFSIAILCNAGESADDRTRFAGRILDLFVTGSGRRPTEPARPAPPAAGAPASQERRTEAYAPTADELTALAGRYESDELMATFEVTPGTAGLMVRHNDAARAFPFTPVARDTFRSGRLTLRFQRDPAGKVIGLAFTNPVLRNIAFLRMTDCPDDH